MTTSDRFRTIARALQPHINDTYDLLAAADAIDAAIPVPAPVVKPTHVEYPHLALVYMVLGHYDVMQDLVNGKKIVAIKQVRHVSNCGLKAAKDAVEDWRVTNAVKDLQNKAIGNSLSTDPWSRTD